MIGNRDAKWNDCVLKMDPRINFLLCYGTADSPSIHIMQSTNIFDQLERASRNYLQSNIKVEEEKKEVKKNIISQY